ncbi:MAG TPA: Ig-like domain-containing protein [Acidobacteriaceae bacterium]
MIARRCVTGILVFCAATALVGCGNPQGLDSVLVSPAAQSLTVGQTLQLTAIGTYGNANHSSTQNITTSVTWTSATPSVATVNSSGLVTAVSGGTTTITASAAAFNGPTSSSAILTVASTSGGANGGSGGSILSLTIIPSSITVGNLQDTGQFLAIGTFSTAPTVRDLTNSPTLTWISSVPNIFPVDTNTSGTLGATAGIVTAYGIGTGVIIAEATDTNGSIATATATFACPAPDTPPKPGQCYQGSQAAALLSTVTVYNEGLNTSNWEVTAPSATGTPNVIHCGPGAGSGGSVCVATYPLGTSVTLRATGGAFGGWSYNCVPTAPITAAGPNSCVVTISGTNTNVTVGAIFN